MRISGLTAYRTETLRNGSGFENSSVRCAGHAATARSEFAQIVLGEKNGAGVPKLSNDIRVCGRNGAGEQARTGGRGQIDGADVVLQGERDAVERSANPPGPALDVACPGFAQSPLVEGDNGINIRPYFVVSFDAGQIEFHESLSSEGTVFKGGLQVGDIRVSQIQSGRTGRVRQRGAVLSPRLRGNDTSD